MRRFMFLTTCILTVWLVTVLSCNKDDDEPHINKPPVANAGADINITLPSCSSVSDVVILDGSRSTDPDGDIDVYGWVLLYGPLQSVIRNNVSAKANVSGLMAGEYAFELMVRDRGGLVSRDTLLVFVEGPVTEYNLDLTVNAPFDFYDNYADCYYYDPCLYYDLTTIQGSGSFSPLGGLTLSVYETADTLASSDVHSTTINIQGLGSNAIYLNGLSTVNFEKLIREGGGAFNGTYTVASGSAQNCEPNIFTGLAPLTVTGNLDTTSRSTTLRIQGKVYF